MSIEHTNANTLNADEFCKKNGLGGLDELIEHVAEHAPEGEEAKEKIRVEAWLTELYKSRPNAFSVLLSGVLYYNENNETDFSDPSNYADE